MLRAIAFGTAVLAVGLVGPADAQTGDIGQVFRDFEAVCFSYAEKGYGVETTLLIEQAGFKFAEKTKNGSDIFNSDFVQLVVSDKNCAFGMPQLPFAQMLEWTKPWVEVHGFGEPKVAKTRNGGQSWLWKGRDFDLCLEEDNFPDGTPLTGLIVLRKPPLLAEHMP